jgi:hypothetical protein
MSVPLDDAPDALLESARLRLKAEHDANRYEEQGKRLARRILVAFVLIVLTAVAFFVAPVMGVDVPPIVPVMCFATIVVGAVMAHAGDAPEKRRSNPRNDDCGRAVGCCPGPRPLRAFRDDD